MRDRTRVATLGMSPDVATPMFSTHARYRPSLIALHWLTLLLLAAVYATIELRGLFPRGSDARQLIKTAHFFLGISVFAVTLVRLLVRASSPTPPIAPALPAWQKLAGSAMAMALYGLMLITPVLGYLLLNAEGTSPALGSWALPALMGARETLGDSLEEWHEGIAVAGYWLIGLHALAALYHHYVRHDDTLLRMTFKR